MKIDRNIKIPPRWNSATTKYRELLVKMKIGDSVFLEGAAYGGFIRAANRIGMKIISRKEKNGRRCWYISKMEKTR